LSAAAAVAVIAVLIATLVSPSSSHRSAPAVHTPTTHTSAPDRAAPTCPTKLTGAPPTVPAPPTKGLDATDRLVPAEAPLHAVVCRYGADQARDGRTKPSKNADPVSATGARQLTGGLNAIPADLLLPPRSADFACAGVGIGAHADYLMGLSYPTGTIWLTSPSVDDCTESGNGRFTTYGAFGDQMASAFASGRWTSKSPPPASQLEQNPCLGGIGRLGQERSMVPDSPVSITACLATARKYADYLPVKSATVPDVPRLVALLNGPSTTTEKTNGYGCPHPNGDQYELVVRYASGPDVWIRVNSGCETLVTNGNLAIPASASAQIQPLIAMLRKLVG
jgi:hypothetical protein